MSDTREGRTLRTLDELRSHLEAQQVNTDALQVGAALLALAQAEGWHQNPAAVVNWLEGLAVEVARNWRAAPRDVSQAGTDTVPIHELKKIAKALKAGSPASHRAP
jgi:hypothetical protein